MVSIIYNVILLRFKNVQIPIKASLIIIQNKKKRQNILYQTQIITKSLLYPNDCYNK